ncbi:hypothetical protein CJD36_021885 [Flavipsychrobacter stenotrophus]|uniref:Uncharacterized protein n=1 Tax=Flavipsychrobacter stenotrophus TaxID=2077091 RepID=A0A2S7SPU0_9BACT|nr:hypothetical protein CJD36_021885 [Flavipsychrobacter stenotrophus]
MNNGDISYILHSQPSFQMLRLHNAKWVLPHLKNDDIEELDVNWIQRRTLPYEECVMLILL